MQTRYFYNMCVLCASLLLQGQQSDVVVHRHVTPDLAVSIAHINRSLLKANKYETERAYNQSLVTFSGLFPQVHIATSFSKLKPGFLGSHATDININQLLFSFNGPLQDYAIDKKTIDIASAIELLNRDSVRFDTETSLLDLWNSNKREAPISALYMGATKRFSKAKGQNNVGFLNIAEWENEKALYAEDNAIVLSYHDEYASAESIFKRSLEQDTYSIDIQNTHFFVDDSIEKANKFPITYWQNNARIHRKELLIKDEEIEQAKYIKKKHKGTYLPSAFLFVNLLEPRSFIAPASGKRTSPLIWSAGIRFEWQFDSFAGVQQVAADESFVIEKIMEKHDIENSIKLDIQVIYHDMQESLKQLEAQKERTQAGEIAFNRAKKQFNVGIISYVDFQTAQQVWQQIQFDLNDIKVRTAQKYRELLFKAGYPDCH